MQTDALPAINRRGEELRYVTEHFRDLQGMLAVLPWSGLLLLLLVFRDPTGASRGHVLVIVLGLIVLFIAVWNPWINEWYKRRYGMVANPAHRRTSGPSWALLVILAVFTGTSLFHALDAYGDALNLGVALCFTLPGCFYTVPANGFIRLRRVLYIAGSAIIFFVASILFFNPLRLSMWFALEIILTALLILSLYDHWLLNRLLSVRPEGSYE